MLSQTEFPTRRITLSAGTMLNTGRGHEDDEYHLLIKPVQATVVGPVRREGLPVVVAEIGLDQILFLHQPEPNQQTVKK